MAMLRIAPRIELACWESHGGNDKLLGRIFVAPETVHLRKRDLLPLKKGQILEKSGLIN
jgi:hypothetical protein